MNSIEAIALEVITLLEEAKHKMEGVRGLKFDGSEDTMFDGRAVSIAITHLETAQLWFANGRR